MIRCRTCVIPITRPDTYFAETGECSACAAFRKRASIEWEDRRTELKTLLAFAKPSTDGFNCIVPSSGGKDSTAQVIALLELGARPLIVTATTCQLTTIGRANIDNLARYAPTMEITPNRTVRAKLNRIGLRLVGDISWPEHISIHRVPFRIACDLGIPLIFYGECPTEAYGGPLGTDETRRMTMRWSAEYGGFLGLRPNDVVGTDGIASHDMAPYRAPSDGTLSQHNVEAHFLGQYMFWDSHQNAKTAIAHGMRCELPSPANWWEAENQDNAQTGAHDFFGWLKYGYGRLAAQISVDIRHGLIGRNEALKIVRERDGLFPLSYMGVPLDAVLDHIGMGRAEFLRLCDQFMNRELFVEDTIEWGQHLTLKEFEAKCSRAA